MKELDLKWKRRSIANEPREDISTVVCKYRDYWRHNLVIPCVGNEMSQEKTNEEIAKSIGEFWWNSPTRGHILPLVKKVKEALDLKDARIKALESERAEAERLKKELEAGDDVKRFDYGHMSVNDLLSEHGKRGVKIDELCAKLQIKDDEIASLHSKLKTAVEIIQMLPCPKCEDGTGVDGHDGAGCFKKDALTQLKEGM